MSKVKMSGLVQPPTYEIEDLNDVLLMDLGWKQVGCGVLWTPPGELNKTTYKRKPEALDMIIDEWMSEHVSNTIERDEALATIRILYDARNKKTCSECHMSADDYNSFHQLKLVDKEFRSALSSIIETAERKYSRKKSIINRAKEALEFDPPKYQNGK